MKSNDSHLISLGNIILIYLMNKTHSSLINVDFNVIPVLLLNSVEF